MGWYWTCVNGHVSSWDDLDRPDEDGGCPRCGSTESKVEFSDIAAWALGEWKRENGDRIPAGVLPVKEWGWTT